MLTLLAGITLRITSNSCSNVFQKIMTNEGTKASFINFYTYLGLCILSIFIMPFCLLNVTQSIIFNFCLMGILGALGNYFIIKALSIGELSSLAPINSYKPIAAMIIGIVYLKEIPSIQGLLGILFIIAGTYILFRGKSKLNKLAVFYRSLALIFSGSEAIIIKKIILLTNVQTSFVLWCFAGLIFSSFCTLFSKGQGKKAGLKWIILLVFSVAFMQYSTNFVFSKMNTSYALAIFQLSTILSVFLGVNIFKEQGLVRKIAASLIMVLGASIIILS